MIWSSASTAQHLIHSAIIDNEWIETDHNLVITDFSFHNILNFTPKHITNKWKTKRKVFITKNITEEIWNSYKEDTDKYINNHKCNTELSINGKWKLIKEAILTSANLHLKTKHLTKEKSHPITLSNSQKACRLIGSLIHHYKTSTNTTTEQIKQTLTNI